MIGFEADDRLAQNQAFFRLTQQHFLALLANRAAPATLPARLDAAERRNLDACGFGLKGFVCSMIGTAIEAG